MKFYEPIFVHKYKYLLLQIHFGDYNVQQMVMGL